MAKERLAEQIHLWCFWAVFWCMNHHYRELCDNFAVSAICLHGAFLKVCLQKKPRTNQPNKNPSCCPKSLPSSCTTLGTTQGQAGTTTAPCVYPGTPVCAHCHLSRGWCPCPFQTRPSTCNNSSPTEAKTSRATSQHIFELPIKDHDTQNYITKYFLLLFQRCLWNSPGALAAAAAWAQQLSPGGDWWWQHFHGKKHRIHFCNIQFTLRFWTPCSHTRIFTLANQSLPQSYVC